jgi:hypothetical protein
MINDIYSLDMIQQYVYENKKTPPSDYDEGDES